MKNHTWIVLLIMLILALACKLPGFYGDKPAETIAVTTQSAQTLESNIEKNVLNIPHGGDFQIEITEQQLTSYVSMKLQENAQYPVHHVQIYLRDSQIRVLGDVDQANMSVQAELIIKPYLESNVVQFDVLSAKIGPFNIPQDLIDSMKQEMKDAFEEQLQGLGENYQMDSIDIQNGVMIIKGKKN
jgi:hypothetical protein